MQKNYSTNIIVVSAKAITSEEYLQQEVEAIKEILSGVKDVFNVAKAVEVIDLNNFRVSRKKFDVVRCLCEQKTHPLKFIFNRN